MEDSVNRSVHIYGFGDVRYRRNVSPSPEEVRDILVEFQCGANHRMIAKRHSCSPSTVWNITHRKGRYADVEWPDVSKEQFERNVLGVKRDLNGFIIRMSLAATFATFAFGVLLVSPRAIVRDVWDVLSGEARRRDARIAARLRAIEGELNPEPPEPPSSPASCDRDSGDEQPEEEESQWPARPVWPIFGLPPVYPRPVRDWTEPREFRSQAVRTGGPDRAWRDGDVQEIAGSTRFKLIIGGRGGPGGSERRRA